MWEKVEKANEYRVGIVPRDAILGTGKYNGTDLEATLTGLNPTKEYKGNFHLISSDLTWICVNSNGQSLKSFSVYVIAENTERGLVSAKRMSQALTLSPSLYQAKGTGPSTDGLDDVILKKALGPNSNVKNIGKP